MNEKHPDYDPIDGPDGEQPAREEKKVGPGYPPREYTWQKGAPSPNPKGRKRKELDVDLDIKKLVEDALKKKVMVGKEGKAQTLNKLAIGIETLVNQFAKGDHHARRDLMNLAQLYNVNLLGASQREAMAAALAPDYQKVLDAYVQRQFAAEILGEQMTAATEPVIAPAELRDDDVTTAAAAEPKQPRPPKPKTGKELVDERMREKREKWEKLAQEQKMRESKPEDRS